MSDQKVPRNPDGVETVEAGLAGRVREKGRDGRPVHFRRDKGLAFAAPE